MTGLLVLAGSLATCGLAATAAPAAGIRTGLRHPAALARFAAGAMSLRPRPHPFQPSGPRPAGPEPAGRGSGAAYSANWSGYVASGGTYRRASARWIEPAGICATPGAQYSSFWVGLDGFDGATVEQTGTEVDCVKGAVRYYSWYEMYPKMPVRFANRVRPGDHFTASVTYRGSSRYTLDLADRTRHWKHVVSVTLRGAPNSSAEVVAEAPSSSGIVLPLADFGIVRFTAATVDGRSLASRHPVKIVMADAAGNLKDSVSALTRRGGFNVIWKAAGSDSRRR